MRGSPGAPDLVLKLIASSRLDAEPTGMFDYYTILHSRIEQEHLEMFNRPLPLHLHAVRSRNALTESLQVAEDYWIVYDQAFGQILSRILAFVFQPLDRESVATYLMKLLANRLLIAGTPISACILGYEYRTRFEAHAFEAKPSRQRVQAVICGEMTVMAHERIHAVFKLDPTLRQALISEYLIATKAGLAALGRRSADIGMISSVMAEERMRDYEGHFGPFEDDADRQRLVHETAEKYRTLIEKATSDQDNLDALTDPDLLEECVCDAYGSVLAVAAALRYAADTSSPEQASPGLPELFAASHAALMVMRLVHEVDAIATGLAPRETAGQASTRNSLWRAFVMGAYTEKGDGAIQHSVRAMNMSLYDKVMDSLAYGSFAQIVEPALERARELGEEDATDEHWNLARTLVPL